MSDSLEHHGVKGMKWGVRKDRGRNRQNPNYSSNQRKRDTAVYGKRGAKRINRNMNKGDQVSTARASEKTRRDRVMSKNKYYRQGGKMVGAGAAAIGTHIGLGQAQKALFTRRGARMVNKLVGPGGAAMLNVALSNPAVRVTASVGAAKMASMFAGDITVGARMRAHGYDPNRR